MIFTYMYHTTKDSYLVQNVSAKKQPVPIEIQLGSAIQLKLSMIDRLRVKYLKYIFNQKSSMPSHMVYSETGRFTLYISIYCRMISYWVKLFSGPENKIVETMYKYLFKHYSDDSVNNPWLDCIFYIFKKYRLNNRNLFFKMISSVLNIVWNTGVIKH